MMRSGRGSVRHALSRRPNNNAQGGGGSWLRLGVCFSLFTILSIYTYLLTTTIQTAGQTTTTPPDGADATSSKASSDLDHRHYLSPQKVVATDMTASIQQKHHNLPVVTGHDDDNNKILAMLYPPGLMGGYRNQVIRFLSFCVYAMKNKVERLFLPSILWATEIQLEEEEGKEQWMPIPHDFLFDVEFWNEQANDLPKLADYDHETADAATAHLPCWSFPTSKELEEAKKPAKELTVEVLKRGFLTPIANYSRSVATRETIINPRRVDKLDEVKDGCGDGPMMVYGGGKAAGRLWNDYIRMQQSGGGIPFQVDAKVLQSLRPKREWRDLSMSCVEQHTHRKGDGGGDHKASSTYIALHARMELEMMVHTCGANMEKNLTKVFGMIEDLVQNDLKSEEGMEVDPIGLFIAVNRGGMEVFEGAGYNRFKANIDENIATLNRAVNDGLSHLDNNNNANQNINVFECGKLLTNQYYQANPHVIDHGGLLDSVVNFYLATEALAFIGVRGSSYSTDIWTTRFHQGKGRMNFEYTPDGIKRIPNGGLPPPHKNCVREKKKN